MLDTVRKQIHAPRDKTIQQHKARDARRRPQSHINPAAQRQEIKFHREKKLQHDGKPEGRQGKPTDRKQPNQMINRPIVIDRGQKPKRHTKQDSNEQCGKSEFECRWQPLHDFLGHRATGKNTLAKIACQNLPYMDEGLFNNGSIKPVLRADFGDHRGCCSIPGKSGRRISGDHP